ncbi:fungal specific transcription factor domain-containing protein [Cordyceps javanica]|uniref:Fungal specific transcription factor domain-containing protein n=1 Tax=Cordyceps javanica TaxID=43265 RepID=A0A545V3Q5_9HYPO|nr:fungal specific transcription factor domain-containing protein [Cordyceps javanica]TQW07641.1 fungal specific transcription factor domain-containing protein [Cordyceps javanica]
MNYFEDYDEPAADGGGTASHEPPAGMASPPSPAQPSQDAGAAAAGMAGQRRSSGNVTVYQTTGPDAHTSAIMSPGGSGPALNPRSCVTCRRRKVRCDKQMPCSNCRRAQIPCIFPAPGRAPRQQKPKDPNAPPKTSSQREVELIKRLRKLEGIVEELSGQIEVESGSGRQAHSESPRVGTSGETSHSHYSSSLDLFGGRPSSESGHDTNPDNLRKREIGQQFGRMVLGDHKGTTRYVSSGFWSKMNDEIDAIRTETQRLTDDDDESEYDESPTQTPDPLGTVTDHHSFIFGYRSADVDLSKLHPMPSHATFLWSVFQENVEPLLKVLHVPTIDALLREARQNVATLSPADEALIFVIYFSAITALEPEEVQTNFGADKSALLAQYRFAVEQALAKANFLNTSDITVLQAFTLFLLVGRRHDDSRFCWSLTSLIVRLAQGMGLHRDGTHFNLPPFETEMRRRLWWALITLDLRSGEELGTDMVIPDGGYDTQLPLNINDVDISKDAKEFPEPREGRSDCAVAVVRYEICAMARRIHCASSAMALRPETSSIAEKEQMLIEVYQRIEDKFLRHVVDEMDPLYWVVAMITRVIMAKTCLVIYHPLLFPGAEEQLSNEVRQRLYVAAIEIIECNHKLGTDPRCKQYRWLFKTYTTWHAISYVLVETCRRPWTPLVERAWHAVTGYEGDPVELAKKADHAAVFIPLRKLFARARRHRVAEISKLRANPEEARRLDFAERMDPEPARFGPVPGAEHIMDQARDRWRLLIKPEGISPSPWLGSKAAGASGMVPPGENLAPMSAPTGASNVPGQQVQADPIPSVNDVNYAMNFVDVLMSQHNVPMADFWDMSNLDQAAANANLSTQQTLQNPVLGMQTPKDASGQPLLWADPFSTAGIKLDDVLADDAEMGEDFNWQDWSQSIRGLELGAAQPQPSNSNQRWP